MDYSLMFPSRFLKAVEFKGKDVTLTIERIVIEELPQDGGGMKGKGILSFRETKKQLVLNRTNAECIVGMFGRETDKWVGKRVTFWPAPFHDNLGLGVEVAIRVRGSLDIDAPKSFEVKLPRKRPVRVTMQQTGARPTNGGARPQQTRTARKAITDVQPGETEEAALQREQAESEPAQDAFAPEVTA